MACVKEGTATAVWPALFLPFLDSKLLFSLLSTLKNHPTLRFSALARNKSSTYDTGISVSIPTNIYYRLGSASLLVKLTLQISIYPGIPSSWCLLELDSIQGYLKLTNMRPLPLYLKTPRLLYVHFFLNGPIKEASHPFDVPSIP
jgi:hypothetical protein